MLKIPATWMAIVIECVTAAAIGADGLRQIEPNQQTGSSLAVVVDDLPLIHTAQLFPGDAQGKIPEGAPVDTQISLLLEQVASSLRAAGGDADRIVKLNVYASNLAVVSAVEAAFARRFDGKVKPAVSYVITRLAQPEAVIAMDAVAVASSLSAPGVVLYSRGGSRGAQSANMPAGSRIYVAGQAEKGATLAEATRRTLDSLRKTLQFLGRQDSDIVQLKSFLSPMADVAVAQREMELFFGELPVPPSVWVEWQSPLIEIELIAWGGDKKPGTAVEFITPPGMTASPVYCRVTRTHSNQLIYLSGLYARQPTDAAGEVTDIFEQLDRSTKLAGSDLRHLVKATYYCSGQETSAKLNELRPRYYDPTRPPSASKALVTGVGRESRGLTIDMIAVPHP
jgi:enamine deaminase RidA (YjgF/YER057c/UK114 family)